MPFKYCAEIQIMKHFHLSFLKRSRLLQQLVGSLHIHGQVAISVLLFLLPHNRVMFGKKKSYIYDKRFYQNTLRWNEAAVLQQNNFGWRDARKGYITLHSLLMIEKTAFIDLEIVIICLFTLANFWESMRKSRN